MSPEPNSKTCRAESSFLQCASCGGEDYVTRPGQEGAVAALCDHVRDCRACGGSGFRPAPDERGYEVMRPCPLGGLKRRIALYNRAGIPAKYHAANLEGYQHRGGNQNDIKYAFLNLRSALEGAVEPGGRLPRSMRGLGLSGPPGVGKTHLMAAMARHLVLGLGVPVRFTDFSHLLWSLRAGFDAGQGESQLIAPLVEVEVLFIDEMGKGRGTEWEIGILDALVSERYNRGLMTFFSTNHPFAASPVRGFGDAAAALASDSRLETLGDRVTPRIASRLQAMCEPLTIQGPDSRSHEGRPPPEPPRRAAARRAG